MRIIREGLARSKEQYELRIFGEGKWHVQDADNHLVCLEQILANFL